MPCFIFISLFIHQGLVFLHPDSENIFQKQLPIRELAATPKSGFWQKGILWGVLLAWNYNFMPLRLHSIILKFRVFVETDPDSVGIAGYSLPLIFFKDNFQSFFYLSIYLTPFYWMSPTHQRACSRFHGYNRKKKKKKKIATALEKFIDSLVTYVAITWHKENISL